MSRPVPTGSAYAPPSAPRTNRQAIWSLILSIITLGGLGSLAGIALGLSARRRIADTGERGSGLAIAGIIVGIITLLAAIAYWIILTKYAGGHGGAGHGGGGGGYGGGGY
jgi:uncharacterized membrane protein YgcG